MKIRKLSPTLQALRPPVPTIRWIVAAVLVTAMSAACDVHTPVGPGEVASITVTPDVTMAINDTQQFVAVALDAEGREVSFTPVWSVETGGGAIDASTGMFTAGSTLGVFTATIRATNGSQFGSATVTVIAGPAAAITVSPAPAPVEVNDTQQFTATAVDAGGNPVSITPTWSVVNGGGTIDADGMFTAGSNSGIFNNTVEATSGDLSSFATVEVVSSPSEIGVTGTLTLDGGGDPDAEFVFQAGSSLTTGGDIVLIRSLRAAALH